jgi:RHS repeat-associated protein
VNIVWSNINSSVRQLIAGNGDITLAKSYDPYGVVTSTDGDALSAYGYTGEDQSNHLVYLRARYYNPAEGRFLSRDSWIGNFYRPISFNKWAYANGNPIYYTDPSGYDGIPTGETIAYCLGIALVVTVDGPTLEALCLLAGGAIIFVTFVGTDPQIIDSIASSCEEAWEQLATLAKGGQTGILTGGEHRVILAEAELIAGVSWGGGGKPPDRAICRALQELERAARIEGNSHRREIIRQVFKAIRCDR